MILRILVISGEHKKGERDGFLVSQPRGCSVLLRLGSNDLGSDKTDTPYSLEAGLAAPHAIDVTITQKHYTMNPKAAAIPASVGLKDSSSSSCVSRLTSVPAAI